MTKRHDIASRVKLRPLCKADATLSLKWRNDPEIRDPQLGHRLPVTAIMEERWFDQMLQGQNTRHICCAVEARDNGDLVGIVQLSEIDWFGRTACFGITIGERRGSGFGRDASTLWLNYAFDDLGMQRVWLKVVAFNDAAINLYRGLGFVEEGRLRRHAFVRGEYHDVLCMGLQAEEWKS